MTLMVGPEHGRGASNANSRGSSYDRQRRRRYLVEAFRADVDVLMGGPGAETEVIAAKPVGSQPEPDRYEDDWTKACRCYRCGALLTVDTVTVDRIIPGCKGGTYRRDNIRPACGAVQQRDRRRHPQPAESAVVMLLKPAVWRVGNYARPWVAYVPGAPAQVQWCRTWIEAMAYVARHAYGVEWR